MRLGNFDIENIEQDGESVDLCTCCGFIRQEEYIKMCVPFDQIKNMGISTYLYFLNFLSIGILLIIMIIIFSVYSLITNILAANA